MEQKEKNILETLPVNKLLVNFAIPSIIAMLVSALYNIVDQFFIGRSIGELGNAATNVAFPLSTLCVAIALLLGIGGSARFNLNMGMGNKEKATFQLGNAAVLLFVLGTILCIVVQIFLTPLLIFFGSPENVLGYAQTYTRITAFGFPFLILSAGGAHLVRADGNPRFAMISNLIGAGVNTVLDAIFIFGFGMGMAGAALATVIGQVVSGILVIRYLRNCKTVKLRREHLIPRWEYAAGIVALGASPFFNQIAMSILQIVLNKSLTYYGAMSVYGEAIPLACVGVISKVNMLYSAVIIGMSQGMQPILSFNYGAGNYKRVKDAYLLVVKVGLIVSAIAFIMFQVFPRQITSIFGNGSDEYYQFAINYFRIFLFFTFINCIQPAASTFFTAIGKPVKGIFLSLTRQILFLLPLVLIFPIFMGIDGIMYAGPIADVTAAIVAVVMITVELKNMQRIKV